MAAGGGTGDGGGRTAQRERVFLPLIAAPMTGVSGPELVAAACRAGVIGSFPTRNCGSVEELDEWLTTIEKETAKGPTAGSDVIAPVAANLIVHRTYPRRDRDIDCLLDHGIDLVITSVGSPRPVVGPLHEGGCRVFADVASLAHAHKALADGVDGLVLLGAGAGGQTGWANPLAFVRAVRAFYDGPIVLAGGVSDGAALAAAVALGCDLAYMGTKFIATDESLASDAYKRGVVEGTMDDVSLGVSDIGIAASRLASGGSAGHTVSGVDRVMPVEELVATTAAEWRAAWAGIRALADAALAGVPSTA